MAESARQEELSPAAFLGNFHGYIAHIQQDLEAQFGDDAGDFDSVPERAQREAEFIAARNWLVERWGSHFPCPVCRNVQWVVSEVGPALRPAGFFSFHVTCGYCANSMQVVPGRASQNTPERPNQLELSEE